MGRILIVLSAFLAFTAALSAQPMSGDYTVGGSSPSFATLQDAANAIKAHGVSGPVFISIRPGVYTRDGGATRLMVLDSTIAGASPTNRITFQPDVATGGNPSNVILQGDFNIGTPNGQQEIVLLGTDHTTIRNLTFKDADSLDTPARFLIQIQPDFFWNTTVEGVVVEGCTFIGTPYYLHGQEFGTDFGVYASGGLITARITGNHFVNLRRAASFDIDSAPSGDSLVAEDNRFERIWRGFTGSGRMLGAAIEMVCAHPSVRRNFVTQSSGSIGIEVTYPVAGIIEGNYVQGSFTNGQIAAHPPSSQADRTDSLMVRNNITMGTGAMEIRTGHTKVLHNTIIHYGSFGSTGLWLTGAQCTVLNNILLVYGGGIMYEQLGSVGLVSDHNVFFATSTYFARDGGGQYYFSFDSYRSGSRLDSNSHFTDVSFISDSLGIHLDECEAQNGELDGIPLPEVRVDYYGARRDSVRPFIGAVEGVRLPYDMFADPFKAGLPGFPSSLSVGRFDNSTAPGIAIPDYDHRQVFLFHNQPSSRSFVHSGTLFPGFKPVAVQFFDLDHDGHLDLVVGGDTAAVRVYWGDGAGGFPADTILGTHGPVYSLDTGRVSFPTRRTVIMTENDGFLPSISFLCYLSNDNGRHLQHETVLKQLPNGGAVADTIFTVLDDLIAADLNGDGVQEVASLGVDFPPSFFVFVDTAVGNFPWGHHNTYHFGTGSLAHTSNIVLGDFNGDGLKDLITTGASENKCVFLRNQGNLSFAVDTIPATAARCLVALDYDNDGDLDIVTVNRTLDSLGVTVFLNNGTGHFTEKKNCYFPFASGWPDGVAAADLDLDGKTDIAVVSRTFGGFDSLFILYNLGGFNSTTEVRQDPVREVPEGFTLFQNYPNPFNPSTRIEYSLTSQSHVTITIYNLLGQEITRLVDEVQMSGTHVVEWKGRSTSGVPVSSGVYFFRIEARESGSTSSLTSVRKMLLLK